MSVDKTRCLKCRGQGEYAGIGGIMKNCIACDGKGKIEVIKDSPKETLPKKKVKEVEAVSAPEAFESMGIPASVINEVITKDLSEDSNNFPKPELDELTQAILDEPRMEAMAWAKKWCHVKQLFAMSPITGRYEELITKVQRAGMRATFAQGQEIAPRVVDLSKAQDSTIKSDPEYKAYQAQEKKLKEAAKKKMAAK
jgi:hypothetical protein